MHLSKCLKDNIGFEKYQSSVATDKMVHGLSQAQLAHRWEHTKCITG